MKKRHISDMEDSLCQGMGLGGVESNWLTSLKDMWSEKRWGGDRDYTWNFTVG